MKTLEQMKKWYISAVKANIVLSFGQFEEDAEKAIEAYGLKEKLDRDPEGQLENDIDGVTEDIVRKFFVGRSATLFYKGYHSDVRFDSTLKILYGRIDGISEFVEYSSDSLQDVEEKFHEAVDNYLHFCQEYGKTPEREEDEVLEDSTIEDIWQEKFKLEKKNDDFEFMSPEELESTFGKINPEEMEKPKERASGEIPKGLMDNPDIFSGVQALLNGIDPDEQEAEEVVQEIEEAEAEAELENVMPSITTNGYNIPKQKTTESHKVEENAYVRTSVTRRPLGGVAPDGTVAPSRPLGGDLNAPRYGTNKSNEKPEPMTEEEYHQKRIQQIREALDEDRRQRQMANLEMLSYTLSDDEDDQAILDMIYSDVKNNQ